MGKIKTALRKSKCPKCGSEIFPGDEIWCKSVGINYCGPCGMIAEETPEEPGMQREAVEEFVRKLPEEAHNDPLAALMRHLAQQIDDGDVPPREMSNYSKEIRLHKLTLQEQYPEQEADDPTTAAREARERRFREHYG
jgi:hypothetical protein